MNTVNHQQHVIDCDAAPYVPEGLEVEKHQEGGQVTLDTTRLSAHLFADYQKNDIGHEDGLNANVLDYLLANQHLIPEELKGKYVFFPGTRYRGPSGEYIRYLRFFDGEWDWYASIVQ